MPNRAFNIMPTIKFSIRCVTMADASANKSESSSRQRRSLKSVKRPEIENVQEDVLRHMCEYCGYRTRIIGNLRTHKRRHTGEKPFRCNICNATFVARYQLNTHNERHMDVGQRRSRYVCSDCNVGFLSARALYHHRPLHAEVKQYKCTLCDKSYAQAAGYAQHKRWHRQHNERATATTKFKTETVYEAEDSN